MSWQQDQTYGGYSNYGGYGEGQTDSAIDMFDEVSNSAQNTYQESGSSFYDPNAYGNTTGAGHGVSQTSHYQPQPASTEQTYQRG